MFRTSSVLSLIVLSGCFLSKAMVVTEEGATPPESPVIVDSEPEAQLNAVEESSQDRSDDEFNSIGAIGGAGAVPVNKQPQSMAGRKMKRMHPSSQMLSRPSRGRTTGLSVPMHQPVQVNTEQYTEYGVSGFALVERDALSTFSVDVDTASYTIARKKLNAGYLPPTSAVRVEEFVNYFPYEYKPVSSRDPFNVDVEAGPSPWNQANHLVRIGVQGKKVSFNQRKSVHLTFLVDVSGSMSQDDKLGLIKKTLKMLTEELEDGDTVAIATYAGATKVVLEPTPISNKAAILRSLNGLTAHGSTSMGAGIDLAYGLANRSFRQGAVNRVIVASDGDANVGQTSHSELSKKIKDYANKGITLTTVGVGNGNYKDTMMEQLANNGDGNYFYLDSMMEARRVFSDKLTSTMEVIAKDVKIQVEWDKEAVIAYRLVGYENRDIADKDFRNDKVDAGEIGAGHQVTAIYEVAFKEDVPKSFGTVRVRSKAPGQDSPAVERAFVMAKSDIKASFEKMSAGSRLAISVAGFAEVLRGSQHMNEVSVAQVRALAESAARVEYPEDQELLDLMAIASGLRGETTLTQR